MRRRILVLASFAAAIIACHSPGSPTPTPTPTPQQPTLRAIKIDGPTRFAPTSSPKFTATGTMSDGTTQDFATRVSWRTSDANILLVNASGTAVARSSGEVSVIAASSVGSTGLGVMVIPDGTYRLVGTVKEAGLPLSAATVSVISGTGTGLSATTDALGQYKLYGVAGAVQVQVSKPGYDPVTNTATIATDNVLDFANVSETGGPPALAGTYSLSIVAAGDCHVTNGTPLATPDRKRTYTAVVTENGATVQVTLSGANFLIQNGKGNQFSGRASPGHVSFTLADSGSTDYYYYFYSAGNPDVVEQLSADAFLSFWGTADATVSPAGMTGTFSGNIVTYSSGSAKITESCASNHHQFVMTPLSTTTKRRRQP